MNSKYNYLNTIDGQPWLIREALKEYGTKEKAGVGNNPEILGWADELGGWEAGWYDKDSIPWCGLFVAIICQRAKKDVVKGYLRAKNWATWGKAVTADQVGLGDILVFSRNGGGHVGFYVGEDGGYYHVLGGNQSDQVNITRIAKSRIYGIRRAKYRVTPKGVVRFFQDAMGVISKNEQ